MRKNKQHVRKKITLTSLPREYFGLIALLLIVSWFTISYIIQQSTDKKGLFKRRRIQKHERQIVYPPHKSKFGAYCTDEQLISQAQRYQFRKARHELYGNDRISAMSYQSDFYHHHFGSYSVEVIEPKKEMSNTLIYYGIARNANENIRGHLTNFSKLFTMNPSGYCPPTETCARSIGLNRADIEKKIKLTKHQTGKYMTHYSNRFVFTFIRDPIARFISGYTEIEYALKAEGIKSVYNIPLFGELGSIERFTDFVKGLVTSNGARSYLQDIKVGISHIAPQIGTLLKAEEIEGRHSHYINLYHLESFGSEWQQLAKDSKQPKLTEVMTETDFIPHHTHAEDKYNTSKAAWTFLNKILNTSNIYNDLSPKLVNESMKQKYNETTATKYVRVLCRLYLMDYVCLGNYMPSVCADLEDELHEFLGEYSLMTKKIERSYYNIIREYYLYGRRVFAEIFYCILSGHPECVVDFVHSHDISSRDKYDGDEL